jgi:single-stranded DNA-binding protein
MNLTVVRGLLAAEPEERTLPSGERMASLELAVPNPTGRKSELVPVAWPSPPKNVTELAPGLEVAVFGRVRKRFFRVKGVTQSRTEVVADAVVLGRSPKKVAGLMTKAAERLAR